MLIKNKRIEKIIDAIKQRFYFIKNYKNGFSFIFLLPGSLREKFVENAFFHALTKNIPAINLHKDKDSESLVLHAKDLQFRFPPKCFYEADFFDTIYPRLGIIDPLIESHVYQNKYYPSEGEYEKFGVILSEGDYVIDAGSNVGIFSVIASKVVGEKGKVFAFEPLKQISDILEENAERNNCRNIKVENKILGDDNKVVNFYFDLETNYNAASKVLIHENDKVIELTQVTLDEYVLKNNLEKVNFIKADIEGSERDLLKGAEMTIKKYRPKIAIRTYHLPDDEKVLYEILQSFVPEYTLVQSKMTLYAWIE